MGILGIVAEYDPFHHGHLRHLEEARNRTGAELTYVALSSCFRQRGVPALLSPLDRARCALEAGADAVFALPVCWTLRDAEHYALGAVSLLGRLGVTQLAFGAETAEIGTLEAAAELLEAPTERFQEALRRRLDRGLGYPAAISGAYGETMPDRRNPLEQPNDILGVCYLRAIRRLGLSIEPVVIPRQGSDRDAAVDLLSPSASGLREALERGDFSALRALPAYSAEIFRRRRLEGALPDLSLYGELVLARLREMDDAALARLPDLSEGLDRALRRAAAGAAKGEDVVTALTGKRYPAARIRRICASALLGIHREELAKLPLPEEALLLGLRRNPDMTARWKRLDIPVISDFAAWQKAASPADAAAWRLWALLCHQPDTLPWGARMVSLPESES